MVKGETVMPVPGGEITTTEILVPEVAPVEDAPAFDVDIDDPYERVKDDLPELS